MKHSDIDAAKGHMLYRAFSRTFRLIEVMRQQGDGHIFDHVPPCFSWTAHLPVVKGEPGAPLYVNFQPPSS